MPCPDCGHLLCVETDDRQSLFCPRCRGLPVVPSRVVEAKAGWLREDRLPDDYIMAIVQDYDREHLILTFIARLNHIINRFYKENGIPALEFGYLAHIIKKLYELEDKEFGEKRVDDFTDFDEKEISGVIEGFTTVARRLEHIRDGFEICIEQEDQKLGWHNFLSNHDRLQSEYGLCFQRCAESVICFGEENLDDFDFIDQKFRDFDKSAKVGEAETLREFGDAWYEIIQPLKFVASLDKITNGIYFTRLPSDVTVFDLDEFFERLNSQMNVEEHEFMSETSALSVMSLGVIDECGEKVFGDDWGEVRDQIVVGRDRLDAHPFLFEIDITTEVELPRWRKPRQREQTYVVYPKYFAKLLKAQIFPLLQNGSEPKGHRILSDITAARGDVFERRIYEYLDGKGVECFHSAKISRKNEKEIDTLCILNDGLVFIESKFMMVPPKMESRKGVETVNSKFDEKIFNEDRDGGLGSEGERFPEKVDAWMDLEPGYTFSSQLGRGEDDRGDQVFKGEWLDLEPRMLVVSNLAPSYIVKDGVRFLTDLEFYRLMEGREDVIYSTPETGEMEYC